MDYPHWVPVMWRFNATRNWNVNKIVWQFQDIIACISLNVPSRHDAISWINGNKAQFYVSMGHQNG